MREAERGRGRRAAAWGAEGSSSGMGGDWEGLGEEEEGEGEEGEGEWEGEGMLVWLVDGGLVWRKGCWGSDGDGREKTGW